RRFDATECQEYEFAGFQPLLLLVGHHPLVGAALVWLLFSRPALNFDLIIGRPALNLDVDSVHFTLSSQSPLLDLPVPLRVERDGQFGGVGAGRRPWNAVILEYVGES